MAHEAGSELTAESSLPVGNPDGFALLNDLPVDQLTGDLLGMHAAAEGIAKMLHASAEASPFVVAVDADWGMGKSTLLRLVRAKLELLPPSLFEHPTAELSVDGLAQLGQDPGELIT